MGGGGCVRRARVGGRGHRAHATPERWARRRWPKKRAVRLLLDTNVLGKICHPRKHMDARVWLPNAAAKHELLLSQVADYELRRELLRIGSRRSLSRLDELTRELRYVPVTTATWRDAARLWAFLRRTGKATAGERELDGDVLLASHRTGGASAAPGPSGIHRRPPAASSSATPNKNCGAVCGVPSPYCDPGCNSPATYRSGLHGLLCVCTD
ncbi:MAG: type II toxin-antitoxin system VapC family toxin [Myxococcales bacterium]|nr:type II toxin-antitoxin system VapC family toxin [Myxococcales bacterium]